MIQNRFEFKKLELPLKKNTDEQPILQVIYNKPKKNRYKIYFWISLVLILASIGFYYVSNNSQPLKAQSLAIKKTLQTTPKTVPPTYINYHDSIIFLNKVRGERRVISKGFDEYLKKDKIIVKVEENYYNCFCNDLVENYKVGDLIP